jgi:hypothetical protein
MKTIRIVGVALAISLPCGIAAANNDDGFVWIDANTRIKVKPVSTTAGTGASAPEKSSEKAPKKTEKKEKIAK